MVRKVSWSAARTPRDRVGLGEKLAQTCAGRAPRYALNAKEREMTRSLRTAARIVRPLRRVARADGALLLRSSSTVRRPDGPACRPAGDAARCMTLILVESEGEANGEHVRFGKHALPITTGKPTPPSRGASATSSRF